jgi:hypothetical protein
VTQHQDETAASATAGDAGNQRAFGALLASLPGCFARSESRQTFARMTRGMLMELEDVSRWSLAEAIGERGPRRLHHLLSRAVRDEQAVLERTAARAVELPSDGDGILIADDQATAPPDLLMSVRCLARAYRRCVPATHQGWFPDLWPGRDQNRELSGTRSAR